LRIDWYRPTPVTDSPLTYAAT